MKKFLTTFVLYDPQRQALYEKYIRPRFQKYADMHGLKFIEMNHSNFKIRTLHPEFDQYSGRNLGARKPQITGSRRF